MTLQIIGGTSDFTVWKQQTENRVTRRKVSSDVNAEKITLAKEMKALLQEGKDFVINHIRRKQNTQVLAR
jgi:hypothetical protein